MAFNFRQKAKEAGLTAAEVGVIGGSMLLSRKFLDARTLFKNKIAADPAFAEEWYIKHWGAWKLVAGIGGAVMIKNPWAKMAFMGIALDGFIQEARLLTADAAGNNFFDAIGQNSDSRDMDVELLRIADEAEKTRGISQEYPSGVAGYYDEYGSGVAGVINLQETYPATAAGRNVEYVMEGAA